MDIKVLLDNIRSKGGIFKIEDNKLKFGAPKGVIAKEELEILKRRKQDILELLQNENSEDPADEISSKSESPENSEGGAMFSSLDDIPEEYYCFSSKYPKYRNLKAMIEDAENAGVTDVYFNVHEKVKNNTTIVKGRELINYSSYNYLNASGDEFVSAAAKRAIDKYGTSVSASRLIAGEIPLFSELEKEIAELLGTEDSIVYTAGHATNETTIGHLLGANDLILYDAFIHNSVMQGAALSGARRISFPHNDTRAAEKILDESRRDHGQALIALEGVYSMDGDIPDLPEFIRIKKKYKTFLMVDEAHSIGALGKTGRGVGEHFEVDSKDVDIWMGTLSKAFAGCGGYIAGDKALVEYLKYTAPGFIYSVGMTPQNIAASLAAIQILKAEPERVALLQKRSKLFWELARERGFNIGSSKDTPIIPIIVGDSAKCMLLSQALFNRGVSVPPLGYPVVPDDASRLRFFVTSAHTEEQIRTTIDIVDEELKKLS